MQPETAKVMQFKEPSLNHQEIVKSVLRMMQEIGRHCFCNLKKPHSMFPSSLKLNNASEFERGMAAVLLHVYFSICKTPKGRQAALDLGFEPLTTEIKERPASQQTAELVEKVILDDIRRNGKITQHLRQFLLG